MEEEIIMEPDVVELPQKSYVYSIYEGVTYLFAYYGWYLLILVCVAIYGLHKMQPQIKRYLKKRSDDEYAAKYHKNPDLLEARRSAVEIARLRLQEKYEKDAEVYNDKMILKEEKKREDWLNRQCNNPHAGEKLGDNSKSSLRPEFNPLMGSSGGSTYKAPKKSSCAKGGCGK